MKDGIHPKYVLATVQCACGNTWQTMSTQEVLKTDLCSNCHPFFTGEQRIVDTAGQVERFMRRMSNRSEQAGQQAAAQRRTATSKNRANVPPPPSERRQPARPEGESEGSQTEVVAETSDPIEVGL